MDRKKFSLVILSAVFITAVIFFLASKNNLKPQPTNYTPVPTQKPIDLCAPFPTIPREITCKEAKQIALKKLPGLVLEINRKNTDILDPNGPNNTHRLWLVAIKSNDVIKDHDEFVIGIDTVNGEINYFGLK